MVHWTVGHRSVTSIGLRFGLLGCMQVWRNGAAVPIGSGRERTVLAVLLLRAPHPVGFGELAERLWGSTQPADPRAAIHVIVTRLRRRIGEPHLVRTEPGGYSISPQHLDLRDFLARVAAADRAARDGDLARESDELRAGLALWRDQALADVPSESLHREITPMLAEQRLAALQRRIAVDLRLGRSAELVAELRGLTAEHPLREGFWAQLMRVLYETSRAADALTAYETVRRNLVDELGVEPGPELRRLRDSILAGAA